jgi:hypothetical protein
MATASTTMPMPPSQWVVERHRRMDLGRASTSVKMEAPVVVKPDMLSKKASAGFFVTPEMRKGRAPAKDAQTQARLTKR